MKLRGIITILFLTIIVKTNQVKAQELWQLQPWAPDSTYVIGAYASGEPTWMPMSSIIAAGDSLYINGTGDTIFLRNGSGFVPYLTYNVTAVGKSVAFSNNQGLFTIYPNKVIQDTIPGTTKYILHTDGLGSYQFDSIRLYRLGDTKLIRLAIGSTVVNNVDVGAIAQDSIYNVGDTIRLRDGLGEVVMNSGGGPDSTVIADGYGINVTESPVNTWTVSADTTQLATQSDISAFPDGSGETNKVAYWSDANTLTRDTALHWNPTSKILGVGTTSPVGLGSSIHLHGTTFSTVNLTNSTTGQAGTDGSRIYTVGDSLYIANRENARIDIGTNNVTRMTITGAGRVGINNTNPQTTLAVGGEVTISSLDSDGSAPTTSGTTVKVVSDANGKLSFQTNNTGTVTNVGLTLGTSGTDANVNGSPVTGSGSFTLNLPTGSSTNRGLISSTDWTTFNNKFTLPALTSGSVLFSNGSTIAQDNANLFWDDVQNVLGVGTSSPSSGAKLHIGSGDLFIIGGSNRRFLMGSSVSAGFWGGMRWNTSNQLQYIHSGYSDVTGVALMTSDGYTGFRTAGTAPVTPLDVFSSNTSDNGTYQNWAYSAASTLYRLLLKQTVTSGNVRYNFSQVNAGTAYDNVLVFDRGNICVGCTDANRKLQVTGEVRVTDLTTDTPTRIVGADADGDFGAITVGTGLSLSSGTLSSTGDSDWGVFGGDMANWGATGTFGSGLNVGIGTASPSRDLDVNGDTRLRGAIYDSSNSAGTSGQVLTSAGSSAFTWTTPPAEQYAQLFYGGSAAITSNTATLLSAANYTTLTYTSNGAFTNSATNRIRCDFTGTVQITIDATWEGGNGSSTNHNLVVYKNGSVGTGFPSISANSVALSGSQREQHSYRNGLIVDVTTNDYFEFYYTAPTSTTLVLPLMTIKRIK